MKFCCGTNVKNMVSKMFSLRTVYADTKKPKGTDTTEVDDELDEDKEGEGDSKDDSKKTKKNPLNYEDLISQARTEEKNKLYPKIRKLEEANATLVEKNNAHLLTIGTLNSEVASLNQKLATPNSNESEVVSGLKSQLATANAKLAEYEGKKTPEVDEEALRTTIRAEVEAEYGVKLYRIEKLTELGDEILLPELVMGSTKEEIDTSIESAKQRSMELKKKMGVVNEDGTPIEQQKPKPKPKPTPNNPSKNKGEQKVDFEYLASLDPITQREEYAEARKKLGLK